MDEMPLNNEVRQKSNLGWPDLVVVVLYFAFILMVGIWSSRRSKRDTLSGYFLASRNMNWVLVGCSLFASNYGSGHFIGISGAAASTGIGVAAYEFYTPYLLMALGYLFVPVYISSGIYTMPEYLKERFGGQRIQCYLAVLSLILYVFTKISADLYAGALYIQLALNKNTTEWLYISIIILLAMSAIFTIAGGLTAVIWTDFVQTVIMIIGAFILMVIAFDKVGGYQKIRRDFPYAIPAIRPLNTTCGIPPSDYMNLIRSPIPGKSDLPWTGIWFGLLPGGVWYWCTDQVIVQRSLASKSLLHAKGGSILASYLKLLPLWLVVFPGMISRILFPDRVGCADPEECQRICGSPGGCSNIAYAELVINLLPQGLSGLMLAVMMSALMTSLTSIFNSASTIFTLDIWTKFRKNASDKEKLIAGKIFVCILVIISVLWIPIIQSMGNSRLFDYIQSISSFLAPPICAVFLLAIFWSRTNEQGAFWGLIVGLIIGIIRFIIEFLFTAPACWEDDHRPVLIQHIVGNVHFLHFSAILFVITLTVSIAVSLLTKPIPEECLYRLTYWSRKETAVRMKLEDNELEILKLPSQTEEITENPTTNKKKKSRKKLINPREEEIQDKCKEDESSEEIIARRASEFLIENSFWKRVVNMNALFCICVTSFFWGFFA